MVYTNHDTVRTDYADQKQKDALQQALLKYLPVELHNQALKELNKTGQVSDETLNKAVSGGLFNAADMPSVKNAFSNVAANIPKADQVYQNLINSTKDEANATDEELQNKKFGYEGIDQTGSPLDANTVRNGIDTLLKGTPNIIGNSVSQISPILTNFIMQNRRLPTPEEFQGELKSVSPDTLRSLPAVKNFLSNQSNADYVGSALGATVSSQADNIKRVQDLIDARAGTARKEGQVNEFLQNAPQEAAASRNNLYLQQRDSATRYLQDRLAPTIVENLNKRGLAENPGDVGSSIAAAGTDLQSRVEGNIRSLEAEDNNFFADAAYRIKQAKLENSEDALREKIAFERESARARQETSFQSQQTDLNDAFEKELLYGEKNRSLGTEQSSLEVGSQAEKDAQAATLASDAGKNIGEPAGTKVGTSVKAAPAAPAPPSRIG